MYRRETTYLISGSLITFLSSQRHQLAPSTSALEYGQICLLDWLSLWQNCIKSVLFDFCIYLWTIDTLHLDHIIEIFWEWAEEFWPMKCFVVYLSCQILTNEMICCVYLHLRYSLVVIWQFSPKTVQVCYPGEGNLCSTHHSYKHISSSFFLHISHTSIFTADKKSDNMDKTHLWLYNHKLNQMVWCLILWLICLFAQTLQHKKPFIFIIE